MSMVEGFSYSTREAGKSGTTPYHWYSQHYVLAGILCRRSTRLSDGQFFSKCSYKMKQECIPVGCVPSQWQPSPGGAVLPRGECASQGCASWGVVCFRGGGVPACTEADPPVNRMTDSCNKITFATSLQMVIKEIRLLVDLVSCALAFSSICDLRDNFS